MRRDLLPSSDNRMRAFSSVALSNRRNVAHIWNKWFETIHLRDRFSPLNIPFSVVSS